MPEMFQGESLKALYRDRLLLAVKIALKPEETRFERSQEVVALAEEIFEGEGGEPKVVIAAAILGDLLGSQPAGGQTASPSQRDTPGAVTRKILADVGTEIEVIDQVCQIVDHSINRTSPEDINHQIVSDALTLTSLKERRALLEKPAMERLVAQKITTKTGKRIAQERLL